VLSRGPPSSTEGSFGGLWNAVGASRILRIENPGAYINEAQVSRELKLGRTPVHHALDRLQLEGLVSVIPRKGVIVQAVSLDAILQIIDLRHLNEPYGVQLAVARATSQDIQAMRQILQEAPALIVTSPGS